MKDHGDYAGMTVNERLYAAGLLETFDQAVTRRDRAETIRILERVEVAGADRTADALLADPSFYGYSS